jgi:hypothetical protein
MLNRDAKEIRMEYGSFAWIAGSSPAMTMQGNLHLAILRREGVLNDPDLRRPIGR